jgi:hypothetical protein
MSGSGARTGLARTSTLVTPARTRRAPAVASAARREAAPTSAMHRIAGATAWPRATRLRRTRPRATQAFAACATPDAPAPGRADGRARRARSHRNIGARHSRACWKVRRAGDDDTTRRTRQAAERTWLAWWRSGIAAVRGRSRDARARRRVQNPLHRDRDRVLQRSRSRRSCTPTFASYN